MTWTGFAAVIVAFFVTHSIPVRPPVRRAIVARTGERGFTTLYSLLSLAMLSAVIIAAGHAPYVQLWSQAPWQNYVVIAGMFVVCMILAFAIGRPNPFSFGGARNDNFDPAHPGIVRWLRHPVLVALLGWSLLHILPNGNLAHVILFGIFAGFAGLGFRLIDARKRRMMPDGAWSRLYDATRNSAFWPRPADQTGAWVRALCGLAAFAILLSLHPVVIGVSAFP